VAIYWARQLDGEPGVFQRGSLAESLEARVGIGCRPARLPTTASVTVVRHGRAAAYRRSELESRLEARTPCPFSAAGVLAMPLRVSLLLSLSLQGAWFRSRRCAGSQQLSAMAQSTACASRQC
jgi:hypothetical protein